MDRPQAKGETVGSMELLKSSGADGEPRPASRSASDSTADAVRVPAIELVGIRKSFHSRRGVVAAVDGVELIIGEMLDLVELQGKSDRRPRELSGGQQQRVALARALVNGPRALLLDEPLAALDLKLRQAMQIELKRIQREVGITFVFVTHDQNEALTMSDRLVVMSAGHIEQLGTLREVYERPRTRFVAGFIGTSNLLTGTASRVTDTEAVVEVGSDERIVVPLRSVRAGQGDSLEITVRPEKIELTAERPVGDGCAVRGTVTEVVYLGTSTNFAVSTTTGADIVVFQQNSASAGHLADRGDAIWLSWQPEHSYLIG